jgi:hypothetical protein
MRIRRGVWALCATTVVLGVGGATAAPVQNGGFERGNYTGWDVREFGPASWGLVCALPRGYSFSAPPEGFCAAFASQNEVSAQVLSRVVNLREDRRHRLTYQLAWENSAGGPRRGPAPPPNGFITPNSLALDRPNQQFRVDVMKPGAPIRSTDPDHVLMRLFRPGPDDPAQSDWQRASANLTQFAGRKVRLRFAVAVTENVLNLGVDAVKIKTRRQR